MANRDHVAVILAVCAGLSVLALTVAAMFDAYSDPNGDISTQYVALLTGTLGVLIGALAGYIGGRAARSDVDATPPDESAGESDTDEPAGGHHKPDPEGEP